MRNGIRSSTRLIDAAVATLAFSAFTDSSLEHYRGGLYRPAMYAGPAIAAAIVPAALVPHGTASRWRKIAFAIAVGGGLVGSALHVGNVRRRQGGVNWLNAFHGAPIAAPMAVHLAGVLGLIGQAVSTQHHAARRSSAIFLGTLAAVGLVGSSAEAGLLHFRGAFQHRAMYAPLVLPPIAAATLAGGLSGSSAMSRVARVLLA